MLHTHISNGHVGNKKSSIVEPPTSRKSTWARKQVSIFCNDVEIVTKKKPIASTFNIKDVIDDANEEGDTDSVVSCDELKNWVLVMMMFLNQICEWW